MFLNGAIVHAPFPITYLHSKPSDQNGDEDEDDYVVELPRKCLCLVIAQTSRHGYGASVHWSYVLTVKGIGWIDNVTLRSV